MPTVHTQSPISSNHGTPTSSTTTLNDPRNKPLPPNENNASGNLHGMSLHPSPQATQNVLSPGGQPFLPSQHSLGSLAPSGTAGGPSTPTRGTQLLAPSVIISPSAPVGSNPNAHSAPSQRPVSIPFSCIYSFRVSLYTQDIDVDLIAYSATRCRRNNAWRSRSA